MENKEICDPFLFSTAAVRTLCRAVVFVPGDPGELNAPFCLISQFQVSGRIRFLCKHKEQPRPQNEDKLVISCWIHLALDGKIDDAVYDT